MRLILWILFAENIIVETLKEYIDAAVLAAIGTEEDSLERYLYSPSVLTKRMTYAILNLISSYTSQTTLDDWVETAEMRTIFFRIQLEPCVNVAVSVSQNDLELNDQDIRLKIGVSVLLFLSLVLLSFMGLGNFT